MFLYKDVLNKLNNSVKYIRTCCDTDIYNNKLYNIYYLSTLPLGLC